MGVQLYANNAATTLAAPCSAVATEMTLTDGSNFPNPSGGDWFLLTLYQLSGAQEINFEIVKVTARVANVITVVRAFEDATRFPARSYTTGDFAELRRTAGSLGLASQTANVPAGNIVATDVQAAITELDNEKIAVATKDASGGVVGLTTWKINFRNAANTFTSWFVNAATAARTYTFPDKDGTVAMLSDITGTNSGTNTGDETVTTVGALINGATAKATPVDADFVGLMDSAASNVLKKLSWANVKATLKTYFDTLYSTATGVETLTNKTLTTPVVNGYTEGANVANTGTAYTINITEDTVQILTLTGNCTYTFPAAAVGKSFLLVQKQDATGSRTATWPAAVKWPSSTAPTLTSTANKADVFAFTSDGTNWYGRTIGSAYL